MSHTQPQILIEVCVDSVESALNAVRGGADRLELCSNLGLGGGTTPSIGLLRAVQSKMPNVPIMAMVRPRTGDFVYTKNEVDIMLEDIKAFKDAGVQGVVFGILTTDGRVDCERTKRLVEATAPLQGVAFDMAKDPYQAFRDVASIPGITRILTSGHKTSVVDALDVVRKLVQFSRDESGPSILPGSGINAQTVEKVLHELTPSEVHMSGGGWVDAEMEFKRDGMGMGVGGERDWSIWRTSEAAVRNVRNIVDGYSLQSYNSDKRD
ncbi:hypothetical protein AAF712_004351 [Marasmius tenuissimus]|uniref:Copper homeostasis protein cutC homolog n=1 Tax=Marasmius tenuissimus TaxID=585030 RepID=A0ABR3A511_9AGAR